MESHYTLPLDEFLTAKGIDGSAETLCRRQPAELVRILRENRPAEGAKPDSPEVTAYVAALTDALERMDERLYEHYRAVADLFREYVTRENLAKMRLDPLWIIAEETGKRLNLLTEDVSAEAPAEPVPVIRVEGPGAPVTEEKVLFVSARSATVLLDADGLYALPAPAQLTLNGKRLNDETRCVASLFGLLPDTEYELRARFEDGREESFRFRTEKETCTLNVRRFGAKGDGQTEDTPFLQAAILSCPDGGRVLLPAGNYVSGPLFLKSNITVEIAGGATLSLLTDRNRFPVLPGVTFSADGKEDTLLSFFEGNPLECFASAINGIGVENVKLIGEGVIDGRAQEGDWWENPKEKRGAYRGNMLYTKDCRGITVQGLTFRNSPCWNLHPTFSRDLDFLNIQVIAPWDSPNTDGFDPESCDGVRLLGARLSVGDDCIAIKAGKIYMGQKYHTPCRNIEIAWCEMLDGHGGVTLGSEMAGGILNVRVHHCRMYGNDRGLRIKTRRGRGKNAVIDDIRFEKVRMEKVKVPLVVNCLYFCDPDGHAPWVQSREKQPVDDGTPTVGRIAFEQVDAEECSCCAGYILGLPEKPVESVTLRNCRFTFAADAEPMAPAMADGVPKLARRGIIASGIEKLITENVTVEGIEGEAVTREDI